MLGRADSYEQVRTDRAQPTTQVFDAVYQEASAVRSYLRSPDALPVVARVEDVDGNDRCGARASHRLYDCVVAQPQVAAEPDERSAAAIAGGEVAVHHDGANRKKKLWTARSGSTADA